VRGILGFPGGGGSDTLHWDLSQWSGLGRVIGPLGLSCQRAGLDSPVWSPPRCLTDRTLPIGQPARPLGNPLCKPKKMLYTVFFFKVCVFISPPALPRAGFIPQIRSRGFLTAFFGKFTLT